MLGSRPKKGQFSPSRRKTAIYATPKARCTRVIADKIATDVFLRPWMAYTLVPPCSVHHHPHPRTRSRHSPHCEEQLTEQRHHHKIKVLHICGHGTTARMKNVSLNTRLLVVDFCFAYYDVLFWGKGIESVTMNIS